MSALKAMAALLTYPEAELKEALPEIGAALAADRRLNQACRDELAGLIAEMDAAELMEAQERYVGLFDRSPSLSLHLYEHVHGESRDRGMAMVRLAEIYERHGLEIDARELPDYLPLFLEFLSLLPEAESKPLLTDAGPLLARIGQRLSRRDSRYAAVFTALCAIGGAEMPAAEEEAPEQAEDFAKLDEAWEEAAVTFGPQSMADSRSGCERAAAAVARMNGPAEGMPS